MQTGWRAPQRGPCEPLVHKEIVAKRPTRPPPGGTQAALDALQSAYKACTRAATRKGISNVKSEVEWDDVRSSARREKTFPLQNASQRPLTFHSSLQVVDETMGEEHVGGENGAKEPPVGTNSVHPDGSRSPTAADPTVTDPPSRKKVQCACTTLPAKIFQVSHTNNCATMPGRSLVPGLQAGRRQ